MTIYLEKADPVARQSVFWLTIYLATLAALGPLAIDMYLPAFPRIADSFGAQHEHLPLIPGTDTSPGHACSVSEDEAPDAVFNRQWGLAVLGLALAALATEHDRQGKAEQFQLLKPWLSGDVGGVSQAEAAARLGLSEGAVKVAIHRFRKRFRDLVKAEIAQTVSIEKEVREDCATSSKW